MEYKKKFRIQQLKIMCKKCSFVFKKELPDADVFSERLGKCKKCNHRYFIEPYGNKFWKEI